MIHSKNGTSGVLKAHRRVFIHLNFETAPGAKYGAENEPVPLHRVRAKSICNQGSLEGTC